MKDIAQIIKKARREQGYTIHSLAVMAGLSHTVVSRIEKGNLAFTVYSLDKICQVLGLKIALLPATKEEITEDETSMYVTAAIGKLLGMDGKQLSEKLCEKGILYKQGHSYFLSEQYVKMGYAINREVKNGYWVTNMVMWSEKGKNFILEVFSND